LNGPVELVLAQGKLFWTSPGAGLLQQGNTTGGPVITLVKQTGGLGGLSAAAMTLFWAETPKSTPQVTLIWRLAR